MVLVLLPPGPVTVSLTVKEPTEEYGCDGFCKVEVVPSPKFQRYDVITPVEASVNWTNNGAVPEVGVPKNPATGAGGVLTVMYFFFVIVLLPTELPTVNLTV